MRRAFSTFAVFLPTVLLAQTASAPPTPPATGLIVGQVVDGTTGQPIADATVASEPYAPVATTSDGRFVLRGVKAGPLRLFVTKPGYIPGSYGETRPNGVRTIRNFLDGEKMAGATIKMWRYAAISGRVVDEAGEPIVGITVRALRRVMRTGEWRLGAVAGAYSDGNAQTDDRGEYRLSDLAPGNWVVAVISTTTAVPTSVAEMYRDLANDPAQRQASLELSRAMSSVSAPRGLPGTAGVDAVGDLVRGFGASPAPPPDGDAVFVYPTQYFAGASTPGRAQAIPLAAGEDHAGIDFGLRPIRAVKVSGIITGPSGPAAFMPLRLVPRDTGDIDGEVVVSSTISDRAGRFTFLGVVAGEYSLRSIKVPNLTTETQIGSVTRSERAAAPPDLPTLWASQDLSVGATDVSGVTVALASGLRIGGRIAIEAPPDAAPLDLRGMQLTIESVDGRPLGPAINERINLGGPQFLSIEIPPGRYFVRAPIFASLSTWSLVSVMSGGRDVSETPLTLDDHNVTDLVVTISKQAKVLTGTVRGDRSGAVTEPVVLAFPASRQDWIGTGLSSRRFQIVRTGRNGSYELRNLPSGEYCLSALADDPGVDWRDPQLLARWSVSAPRVTVTAASAAGPDLQIRPGGDPVSKTDSWTGFPPSTFALSPGGFLPPLKLARSSNLRTRGPENPTNQSPSGRISGVVVTPDGTATQPVRRAVVTLACANPAIGRTLVTGDTGTFVFDALPACRYTLEATKVAYLTARYGAKGVDRPGTPITLGDGQRAEVRLTMPKGGVVAGVVRDIRGEPMPGVIVQAMRFQYSRGEWRFEAPAEMPRRTDGRGAYRIYGLPPGEFIIGATANVGGMVTVTQVTAADVQAAMQEVRDGSAAPRTTATAPANVNAGPRSGYAPVFHPGTPAPGQAERIKLEPGDERLGVDITMQLARVSSIRVHVLGPDGQPPATTQARLWTPVGVVGLISVLATIPVETKSGGELMLPSVPPGEYTLAVSGSTQPIPAPAGRSAGGATIALPQWAIVPVFVTGENLDLTIQLEQGKTVSGHVVFDGASPPAEFKGVAIGLSGPSRAGVTLNQSAKPATSGGAFALDSVVPAAYRVVNAPIKGWSIASALINGQDASDRPVEIAGDVSDAVVTFTDKTTELSGMLQTPAGQPALDYHVIVFPTDRSYWVYGSRRIVSIRPATDGRFVAATLPPGEYLIAAVTDVANEEWFNPAFLADLESAAVRVTVRFGQKTVQDLRIR